jgi:Tol biopolymer transport system component
MKWKSILLLTISVGVLAIVGCGSDDSPTGPTGVDLSNSKIAFIQDNSLYTVDIDGDNKERLGSAEILVHNAWSPDGRHILFFHDLETHVFNVEERSIISLEGIGGLWSAWSPEGKIVWAETYFFGEAKIQVINPDGSDRQRVTSLSTGPTILSRSPWFSDGSKILFGIQDKYISPQKSEMYEVSIDGSGKIKIGDGFAPAVSPDGQKIAYANSVGLSSEVYIMNIDGTEATKVGEGEISPSYDPGSAYIWSPDSQKLILIMGGEVASISINGGGNGNFKRTHLFPFRSMRSESASEGISIAGSALSFSPDGGKMVIEEEGLIYTINADGSEKTPIVEGQYPSWSPILE